MLNLYFLDSKNMSHLPVTNGLKIQILKCTEASITILKTYGNPKLETFGFIFPMLANTAIWSQWSENSRAVKFDLLKQSLEKSYFSCTQDYENPKKYFNTSMRKIDCKLGCIDFWVGF